MPVGATPVDFAYTIHTDVGHSCIGSKVNGRLVPARLTRLESGDNVEIFTSKVEDAGPSRDWLKFVASRRAANKIKQWYTRERREDAIEHGRDELLIQALRREGLPAQRLLKEQVLLQVGEQMNYADDESLFAADRSEGHVAGSTVAERIARELRGEESAPIRTSRVSRHNVSRRLGGQDAGPPASAGVHVEGLDDIMIRHLALLLAGAARRDRRASSPVAGGVSVHRADCLNAATLQEGQPDRLIEVEWDADHDGRFATTVEVQALDRSPRSSSMSRRCSPITDSMSSGVATETGDDAVAKMQFEFELADVSQLDSVLSTSARRRGGLRRLPADAGRRCTSAAKPESNA